jgi:hypothetical protein
MEHWTRWHPLESTPQGYRMGDIEISANNLKVELIQHDDFNKLEIVFNTGIEAYRFTNESWCFMIFNDLSYEYGTDFYANWHFFKIDNSEYIKSVVPCDLKISSRSELQHFCIMGNDEILDILAYQEPQVKMITL